MLDSRMANLMDAIRRAVEKSPLTKYRIAKDSGISPGQLSRLVHGERKMTVETVETLARSLGYEIIMRKRRKRTTTRKAR